MSQVPNFQFSTYSKADPKASCYPGSRIVIYKMPLPENHDRYLNET